MCSNCFSTDFERIELSGKGKLLTYTVIHVAPKQFETLVPYAVGIIVLENELKLPGMIFGVDLDKIKIGMKLEISFGECMDKQSWHQFSRYCFKPV